jgi:hypothetical protein
MKIEFENLVIDEENSKITLHLQTEHHDFGFKKVIPLNDETDTPQKLKAYIEGMAAALAAEYGYDEATFAWETCGYIGRIDMPGAAYTEEELSGMSKSELLDAANKAGVYTEDMEKSRYTKAMIIEKILEAQEPEEPEEPEE